MHRFFIGNITDKSGHISLDSDVWINNEPFTHQVARVLRLRIGEDIVLFDGKGRECIYEIVELEDRAVHVKLKTVLQPHDPARKVTLAWALLKKDKNDWVVQKCTELGVAKFLPLITDRTEKTGFNLERAVTIAIEAVEQCGRHTLPEIHEPQSLPSVIGQLKDHTRVVVADMTGDAYEDDGAEDVVVLIGPEGGWSDKERQLFVDSGLTHISLSPFTLRAETASVAAIQSLAV